MVSFQHCLVLSVVGFCFKLVVVGGVGMCLYSIQQYTNLKLCFTEGEKARFVKESLKAVMLEGK